MGKQHDRWQPDKRPSVSGAIRPRTGNNKSNAYNRLAFKPLIIGLLGMVYHF